jgi:DNA polymerase
VTRDDELAAVAAEASECRRCELAESRTNVVFGIGPATTPLMLVGEGPGQTEDATGLPFVGRAGALLDKALQANGMLRKHVYITNIVKCRASLVENGRVQNRPPRVAEVDACRDWLLKQIAIIRPLVIVCIGGPSANLLIRKGFQISRERGTFYPSSFCHAIVAVLHPAYILRQDGPAFDASYGLLVQDLGAARQKVIELKRAIAAGTLDETPHAPEPVASDEPEPVPPAAPSLFDL